LKFLYQIQGNLFVPFINYLYKNENLNLIFTERFSKMMEKRFRKVYIEYLFNDNQSNDEKINLDVILFLDDGDIKLNFKDVSNIGRLETELKNRLENIDTKTENKTIKIRTPLLNKNNIYTYISLFKPNSFTDIFKPKTFKELYEWIKIFNYWKNEHELKKITKNYLYNTYPPVKTLGFNTDKKKMFFVIST
jgi:hypothetical protein